MPEKKLSPEAACSSFIGLKAELKHVEEAMDELKKVIEPFLETQPEETFLHDGWEFKIVRTVDKETFSLKACREAGKIDGRKLAPYISKCSFNQIRTTWKGGKE